MIEKSTIIESLANISHDLKNVYKLEDINLNYETKIIVFQRLNELDQCVIKLEMFGHIINRALENLDESRKLLK